MSEPTILTREDVTKKDRNSKVVDIPEWGGAVRIRGMSTREIIAHNKGELIETEDGTEAAAMLVVLFTVEPEFKCVDEVLDMEYRGLLSLANEIMDHAGLTTDIDEVEGNSEETASDDSAAD